MTGITFNPKDPSLPSTSFVPRPGAPSVLARVDDLSAYSSDIAAGNSLTIVGFSKAVLSATNELNDTTWHVQEFNANSRNAMYEASTKEILSLIGLLDKLFNVTAIYSDVFKKVQTASDSLNGPIDDYNGNVNSNNDQVKTLNLAIAKYNAGQINATQLQTVINDYNTYAQNRNFVTNLMNQGFINYNTNLNSDSQELQTIINELIERGISPSVLNKLTLQPPYGSTIPPMPIVGPPPPSSMPLLTFQATKIPRVTNVMNPLAADNNGLDLATEIFAPYFELLKQLAFTTDFLQSQSDYSSFIQFFLNNVPYLSSSFYQSTPDVQMSSSAGESGGTGSGVSLSTIITSLSTSMMEGIVSQGKFTEAYGASIKAVAPRVVNELLYLGLGLLSTIGLQAGSPALRLLQGRLPFIDIRSSPVLAVLGLKVTGETAGAVSSEAITNGVKEILTKSFPNLDATSLNALAQKLASVIELFILQASLVQLAQVLNIPDLANQVFSTLPQAKTLNLGSPLSNADLQRASADILKQEVMREEIGRSVLNASINHAEVKHDLAKADAAFSALINDNLVSEDAATEAVILKDTVNHEVSNANILSREIVTQAINNATINGDFNQKAVINTLVANGVSEQQAINAEITLQSFIKSEIVGKGILDQSVASNDLKQTLLRNEAVNKIVTDKPTITNRELRDQLVTQFIANGATAQEAIASATLLVTGKSITAVPESLSNILYDKGLSVIAGIGLSESQTKAFANEVVNTVLGPSVPGSQTSIRDLLDLKLSTLVQGEDMKTIQKVKESFDQFLAPSVEFYVFAQQLRDPGNTFIGIMYDHPKPTNFKNSVDIAV